jgi:hypothetical protein
LNAISRALKDAPMVCETFGIKTCCKSRGTPQNPHMAYSEMALTTTIIGVRKGLNLLKFIYGSLIGHVCVEGFHLD